MTFRRVPQCCRYQNKSFDSNTWPKRGRTSNQHGHQMETSIVSVSKRHTNCASVVADWLAHVNTTNKCRNTSPLTLPAIVSGVGRQVINPTCERTCVGGVPGVGSCTSTLIALRRKNIAYKQDGSDLSSWLCIN